MKAKLTLNGKEYEVEITEDQVSKIESVNKPKTGFNFGGELTKWYVSVFLDNTVKEPCFSNRELCEDYTRAINLFLELSEWQARNDALPIGERWYIRYYNDKINAVFTETNYRDFMEICFSSSERAEQAIAEFHNELTWYFTEFKPRLDM